jgi:uncharacterized membrane-anchored protein YhcB (DUF1043 family)
MDPLVVVSGVALFAALLACGALIGVFRLVTMLRVYIPKLKNELQTQIDDLKRELAEMKQKIQ